MEDWKKLIDANESAIPQGTVFRFPSKWPYEEQVDLMVLRLPKEGSLHSLIVTTGNKAGRVLVNLPLEGEITDGNALSRQWVIDNWAKWIYQDCDVNDVMCLRRYEIPLVSIPSS